MGVESVTGERHYCCTVTSLINVLPAFLSVFRAPSNSTQKWLDCSWLCRGRDCLWSTHHYPQDGDKQIDGGHWHLCDEGSIGCPVDEPPEGTPASWTGEKRTILCSFHRAMSIGKLMLPCTIFLFLFGYVPTLICPWSKFLKWEWNNSYALYLFIYLEPVQ